MNPKRQPVRGIGQPRSRRRRVLARGTRHIRRSFRQQMVELVRSGRTPEVSFRGFSPRPDNPRLVKNRRITEPVSLGLPGTRLFGPISAAPRNRDGADVRGSYGFRHVDGASGDRPTRDSGPVVDDLGVVDEPQPVFPRIEPEVPRQVRCAGPAEHDEISPVSSSQFRIRSCALPTSPGRTVEIAASFSARSGRRPRSRHPHTCFQRAGPSAGRRTSGSAPLAVGVSSGATAPSRQACRGSSSGDVLPPDGVAGA